MFDIKEALKFENVIKIFQKKDKSDIQKAREAKAHKENPFKKDSNTPMSRFDSRKKHSRKLLQIFADFLNKLGYDATPREFNKKIILFCIRAMTVLTVALFVIAFTNKVPISVVVAFLIALWTLDFAAFYLVSILVFLIFLDLRMYQRTKQIEDALPDFLQLTSANISAGMTIDRALWYAVRPKFGQLAIEIEDVAKSTVAGEELDKALMKFSKKYDSKLLNESINLIVAGMTSGGEMAVLLNKISANIKETILLKKEMSASVTTYAIFIAVATIIAAPILFALSTQLLIIIRQITSSIHMDNTSGVTGMMSFNFSGESISIANFKSFSIMMLVMSSTFSAMMISTIRKGNAKDGAKMIPVFIAVAVILYLFFTGIFGALLGGLINV